MGKPAAVRNLKTQNEQRRLSKQELFEPKIVEEEVFIKRLGGSVKIRSLNHERRRIVREGCGANTPEYDENKFELLAVVHSVVDPQLSEADVELLKEQDAGVVDELVTAIQLLNSFGGLEGLKNALSETQNSDSA